MDYRSCSLTVSAGRSSRMRRIRCPSGPYSCRTGSVPVPTRNPRREFGIRIALGARSMEVFQLVLGNGLRVALLGLLIGAVAGW